MKAIKQNKTKQNKTKQKQNKMAGQSTPCVAFRYRKKDRFIRKDDDFNDIINTIIGDYTLHPFLGFVVGYDFVRHYDDFECNSDVIVVYISHRI